jgi:hypothetical protein
MPKRQLPIDLLSMHFGALSSVRNLDGGWYRRE